MVNESGQAGDCGVMSRARECYLRLQIGARAIECIHNSDEDLMASYERGIAEAMGDDLFIQDKLQQFDASTPKYC